MPVFCFSVRNHGIGWQCIGVRTETSNGGSTKETAMNVELSKVETVALAKVVKDAVAKAAGADVTAGEYPVDFVVRVSGSIKKGEDYDSEIVAKADPWLLLAAALSKLNGVTVDALVREALTADEALVEGLKAKAADAIAAVKGPTKTRCAGKITTKLTVQPVAA